MGNWNWGWVQTADGLWIMPYWLVGCIATVILIVLLLLVAGWSWFCFWLSNGKWWGWFLMMSPLLTAPIFIGLYYDLTKGL